MHADATLIAPIDFLRVPLSAIIGWLLYKEQIDVFTAAGAALILAGNLLNLQVGPKRETEPVVPVRETRLPRIAARVGQH